MSKKKSSGMATNYLLIVIFMVVVIGAVVFVNMKSGLTGGTVVEISDGRIIQGETGFQNFLISAQSGKSSKIKFVLKGPNGDSKSYLSYSGGIFTYKDGNGKKVRKTHCLDVAGKNPLLGRNVRYICLADEDYTFAQVLSGDGIDEDSCLILFSLDSEMNAVER